MLQDLFKWKEQTMLVHQLQRRFRLGFMGLFLSLAAFAYAHDGQSQAALTAIGTLTPAHKSTLGSIVSGRVEEVFVDVGDSVKKGQPLLKLDQSFFDIAFEESVAAAHSATIELEDATRNYERMKKLFEKPEGQLPAISLKRFEDAQTRCEQAKVAKARAEQNVRKAQTNLEETVIKAPYDGVITKRFVHPGEPVNATPVTKILEILSIDTVYVEFSLPQIHRSKVHVGDAVEIEVEGSANEKIRAVVDMIYPDIDEKTRSIKCRTIVRNTNRELQPGALVRVLISMQEEHDASI
jgi:membrane fusion protein, multidrug efflux system